MRTDIKIVLSVLIAIAIMFIAVKVIEAHTPRVTFECDQIGTPTLTVHLVKYDGDGHNEVSIFVDGNEIVHEHEFAEEYAVTYQDLDPYIGHGADVEVIAWDDPSGEKGYTKTFELVLGVCREPEATPTPTPSPTPKVTPSPSPSVGPTPSPTPSPRATPRDTLPPTDTE